MSSVSKLMSLFFFPNGSISPKMYRRLRESLDTEKRHLFLAAGSLPDPTTPPPGLIPPLTGTFLTAWHAWPQMSRGFVCVDSSRTRGHALVAPCRSHMSVFISFSILSPSLSRWNPSQQPLFIPFRIKPQVWVSEWVQINTEVRHHDHLAGFRLHAFHSDGFLHTYGLNQWFLVCSVMTAL